MLRPSAVAVVNYEIACLCGRPLRGPRQRSRQIISCPNCGQEHFIFPDSPWLAPAPATARQAGRLNLNRLLLGIVLGGALAMALVFLLLRPYLRRPEAADASSAPADSHALLADGERQLREGNVFLALEQLKAGLDQYNHHPQSLSR